MAKTLFFSVLILLLGLILRFWDLGGKFFIGGDQSYLIWEVANVSGGHLSLVGFEAGGVGHIKLTPYLLYFLTFPFVLSLGHPLFIAYVLSIFGALRAVLFYLIGKSIFGERVGILAAFFYLFSHRLNLIDRTFFGATFLILSSLLVFYLLAKIKKEEKIKIFDLVTLGSVIGISFSAHYQSAFLFLGSLFFLIFIKKKTISLKKIVVFIGSVIVWFLPLILFELRHQFSIARGFFILGEKFSETSSLPGVVGSAQYTMQIFYGIFINPLYKFPFADNLSFPLLWLLFFLIFLPFSIILKVKKYALFKAHIFFFLSMIVFGFFVLIFLQRPHYDIDPYYWFLIPFFIFYFALLVNYLLTLKTLKVLAYLMIVIFLIFNIFSFLPYKIVESYELKNKITQKILDHANSKNLSQVVVKFDHLEAGSFDYLFYYQAKKRNIDPSSIFLISRHDLFQERILLGGKKGPIHILSRGAGESFKPNYFVEDISKPPPQENLSLLFTFYPCAIYVKSN